MDGAFLSPNKPVCPPGLLKLAQSCPPTPTAIVNAGHALTMKSVQIATDLGLMLPLFIGQPSLIQQEAEKLGWDISQHPIYGAEHGEDAVEKAATLARDGDAKAIMKGHIKTHEFVAALSARKAGLLTTDRLVHLFYITDPIRHKPVIVTDAAINVAPRMKHRKSMLSQIESLAIATGIKRPKIAILSATEIPNSAMPSSMEAEELTAWAKVNLSNSDVSGPLAFDLIISPQAAKTKGLDHDKVAGRADAILVPDITSGNAIYKALVYLSGGCAAGIGLGLKVPVLLTSRADPPPARIASAALASIFVQYGNQ